MLTAWVLELGVITTFNFWAQETAHNLVFDMKQHYNI